MQELREKITYLNEVNQELKQKENKHRKTLNESWEFQRLENVISGKDKLELPEINCQSFNMDLMHSNPSTARLVKIIDEKEDIATMEEKQTQANLNSVLQDIKQVQVGPCFSENHSQHIQTTFD